ncbi:MAG: MBL fold metallo-hydrolase [Peptococcaceae bacterium]|nr:MBL fold metallo-hydrolase [Peptococcaceae bacterium]
MTLKITSLVENSKAGDHLLCEPGLSLLIEWRGKTMLLDTGASEFFMDNADTLDKDLSKVDYVVLSHGHSDHSGGIRTLCASTRKKFKLVMNPRFFDKKFIREKDYLRYIGNDFNQEFLQIENVATIFPLTDMFTLLDDVYIISDIVSVAAYEDESNDFVVLKGEQYLPDGFADEQVLVFDLPQGLVVLSGCAHRGIVNTCEAVKKQLKRPIQAIIGGLHLKNSGEERIRQTAAYILREGISHLALGHCTGDAGLDGMKANGVKIQALSSGSVIEFDD